MTVFNFSLENNSLPWNCKVRCQTCPFSLLRIMMSIWMMQLMVIHVHTSVSPSSSSSSSYYYSIIIIIIIIIITWKSIYIVGKTLFFLKFCANSWQVNIKFSTFFRCYCFGPSTIVYWFFPTIWFDLFVWGVLFLWICTPFVFYVCFFTGFILCNCAVQSALQYMYIKLNWIFVEN